MGNGCSEEEHIHAGMAAPESLSEDLVEGKKLAAGKAHAWDGCAAAGKPKERQILQLVYGERERQGDAEPR